MTDSTRKYIKLAQDYVMITLGLFTYAFGFTAFILPEKIVIGSVTGLSSLIHYWVGWNVALTYYAIVPASAHSSLACCSPCFPNPLLSNRPL